MGQGASLEAGARRGREAVGMLVICVYPSFSRGRYHVAAAAAPC